ncbi:MAG: DUF3592 domain-containing protein [Candidatus Eisenbacteria bacterium]
MVRGDVAPGLGWVRPAAAGHRAARSAEQLGQCSGSRCGAESRLLFDPDRYRWVAGRAYVGDRYGLTSSLRRRQADEVVASLSPGTRTTCYVDPHDPTKALMVPGGSGAIAGLWIAIVLLFLGLPALALAGYRLYESLKRG